MQRRDFLALTGLTAGGLIVPSFFGKVIAAEQLQSSLDPALKKRLADAALQAARSAGATYCDVRIGRYLRQFVITREDKVQNVVNTESTGVGIRVIVNGAWGFAAEVLCVQRRLVHRPGHPSHLAAVPRHRHRQGQRQVPHPIGPVLADGPGLRIPGRRRRGQGGQPE